MPLLPNKSDVLNRSGRIGFGGMTTTPNLPNWGSSVTSGGGVVDPSNGGILLNPGPTSGDTANLVGMNLTGQHHWDKTVIEFIYYPPAGVTYPITDTIRVGFLGADTSGGFYPEGYGIDLGAGTVFASGTTKPISTVGSFDPGYVKIEHDNVDDEIRYTHVNSSGGVDTKTIQGADRNVHGNNLVLTESGGSGGGVLIQFFRTTYIPQKGGL